MPAINALLPIVATSNAQKDGAQSRSEESRSSAMKSAATAESKGLDQDAAAEKRLQEKRFISVYEEGIQEQGKQQERVAKQTAERLRVQQNELAALATGGSPLPPVGEPLPISPVPTIPVESPHGATEEPINVLPTQVSQTEDLASPTQSILSDQEQQQAAAAAFHTLVVNQNGKGAAVQPPTAQGLQQAALAAVEPVQNPVLNGVQTIDESASTPLTGVEVDTKANFTDGDGDAAQIDQAAALSDETPLPIVVQSEQTQVSMGDETQATLAGKELGQAELVRAWRGIDAQEMRSAANTPSAQGARQESLTSPIVHSGQIHQFAHSLRLNTTQAESTPGVVSAERSTTTTPTPQTVSDSSPWRAESPSTGPQASGVRTPTANTPFAQTMQASNFGQPLGERVGQNAWGERIAQRVSLMAGQKVTSAQIQLDPPELGAMTIKVSVNGDQASVSFHSPHAMVRDALELSFPRLQEMMSQQGMQLVDAQVSDNGFSGQGSGESSGRASAQSSGENLDDAANTGSAQIVQIANNLIDFYA